jgi:hypothetical protein
MTFRKNMRFQINIVFLVTILLVSCAPISVPAATETLAATSASTFTSVPPTSTPQTSPTVQITPIPWASPTFRATPTAVMRIERWKEYENALAAAFLPIISIIGKVLCEWEILGQAGSEVYAWAMCQDDYSNGQGMSAPAVIHLMKDGRIEKVEVPADGPQYGVDISRMFPLTMQKIIFAADNIGSDWRPHLQLRFKNPGPPLIAERGIPLP